MKIIEEIPSRKFKTGLKKQIIIKDSGKILLDEDEQVTFCSEDKKEYDVTKKNLEVIKKNLSLNSKII